MSMLGNVICLSGTAIYVRLEALLAVFDTYVDEASGQTASLYDHWKYSFGEDRNLTLHLAGTFGHWSTDIHTGTVSETQPALLLRSLILQRRRWFLGTVATEAAALCKAGFWRSSPFLSAYRLCIKPVVVRDLQMILLVLAISQLQLEGFTWILLTVAAFFLMDILVFLSFGAVRRRMGVLMYPFVLLLFPFIQSASIIWALMSLWERRW
jgi:cellulose synthase/poly-beta-1,6-N-acetylglucosamine synthase-like glycosyltransferase